MLEGLHCAELLLAGGATIDAQDTAGLTAVHHAVLADNRDHVVMLMRAGADTVRA